MYCIYMLLCYASYVCHFFYCYYMYILFLVPHLHQPVAEGVTIVNNNNNNCHTMYGILPVHYSALSNKQKGLLYAEGTAVCRRDCCMQKGLLYADGTEMLGGTRVAPNRILQQNFGHPPRSEAGWMTRSIQLCTVKNCAHLKCTLEFQWKPQVTRAQSQWGCTPAAAQLEHLRGAMVCTKRTEIPMVHILCVMDSTRVVAALLLHCIHTNSLYVTSCTPVLWHVQTDWTAL